MSTGMYQYIEPDKPVAQELFSAGAAAEFCAQPETYQVFSEWLKKKHPGFENRHPDRNELVHTAAIMFSNAAYRILRGET